MNIEAKREAEHRAKNLFHRCAQEFKDMDELAVFAMITAALSIALLRGIHGHKFTDGFLMGAIDDTDRLVIRPEAVNPQTTKGEQ